MAFCRCCGTTNLGITVQSVYRDKSVAGIKEKEHYLTRYIDLSLLDTKEKGTLLDYIDTWIGEEQQAVHCVSRAILMRQ